MKKLTDLNDLFIDQLKEIYGSEKHQAKALTQLAQKSKNAEVKKTLAAHAEKTKGRIERLETVFELSGELPRPANVRWENLVERAEKNVKKSSDENVADWPTCFQCSASTILKLPITEH